MARKTTQSFCQAILNEEMDRDTDVSSLDYSDVTMSAMASQITAILNICSTICPVRLKEIIKATRHWPLWGESPGDRWIPSQSASKYSHLITSSCISSITSMVRSECMISMTKNLLEFQSCCRKSRRRMLIFNMMTVSAYMNVIIKQTVMFCDNIRMGIGGFHITMTS